MVPQTAKHLPHMMRAASSQRGIWTSGMQSANCGPTY
jgi:hypothetical protein